MRNVEYGGSAVALERDDATPLVLRRSCSRARPGRAVRDADARAQLPRPTAGPSIEHLVLRKALKAHVVALSQTLGERRIGHNDSLERARSYIESVVNPIADGSRVRISFDDVGPDASDARNVIVELAGSSAELVIVGAHYDSAPGTAGANDNASGVAVLLELARRLRGHRFFRTLRLVFFANEEPPYFQNPGMGSLAHARVCSERGEVIRAMLSLESLGYYSDAPDSQRYPWPVGLFYPKKADFLAFVGNLGSRSLVRTAISAFRESTPFPSEGASLPGFVPGVGWSDHWAFWQFGYEAIMITDTALYRDPHYHEPSDTSATVDFTRLTLVTVGVQHVIERLAVAQVLGRQH